MSRHSRAEWRKAPKSRRPASCRKPHRDSAACSAAHVTNMMNVGVRNPEDFTAEEIAYENANAKTRRITEAYLSLYTIGWSPLPGPSAAQQRRMLMKIEKYGSNRSVQRSMLRSVQELNLRIDQQNGHFLEYSRRKLDVHDSWASIRFKCDHAAYNFRFSWRDGFQRSSVGSSVHNR